MTVLYLFFLTSIASLYYQVSRFFSEVFSELVPDGTGQLLMKSIADDVSPTDYKLQLNSLE